MKYIICLLLLMTSFLFSDQRTLKISNFVDYIDIELLKDFAYKNDIKLIYDIHDVNEDIYEKLINNNQDYDLIIISSNYISKLKTLDKLEKIDSTKLINYSNINQDFLHTNFIDTYEYTIPYLWGTVGLIYNKKISKEPILKWDDLWKEEFKNSILLSNEPSDVIGMVLKSLGYSANSTNINELNEAYEKLKKLIPNIKDISSSNASSYFLTNGFAAGMVYSGDAKLIIDKSTDFEFIYPKEGVLKWADGLVILKDSKNKDLAYKFIDFIIEEINLAKIGNATGYAVSSNVSMEYINKIDLNNVITYPNETNLINSEILIENENIYKKIVEDFEKFKEEYNKREASNEK